MGRCSACALTHWAAQKQPPWNQTSLSIFQRVCHDAYAQITSGIASMTEKHCRVHACSVASATQRAPPAAHSPMNEYTDPLPFAARAKLAFLFLQRQVMSVRLMIRQSTAWELRAPSCPGAPGSMYADGLGRPGSPTAKGAQVANRRLLINPKKSLKKKAQTILKYHVEAEQEKQAGMVDVDE